MTENAFCASSAAAASLSDDEFWGRVYKVDEKPNYEPDEEDYPEMVVGFCLRCGSNLIAEDYQQLRVIIDHDKELCDECTDELAPDTEEIW